MLMIFFPHYLLLYLPLGLLPTTGTPVAIQTVLSVEQLTPGPGEKTAFMVVTVALIAKNIVIKGCKINIMNLNTIYIYIYTYV